ncbi:ribosome maturation factor RimM [Buchnera aphidicola]|uniref:ribosome maturation factor RimM n=1 Tax=Buchnera aphidicola TaxID=9 RepID=UPI00346489CA
MYKTNKKLNIPHNPCVIGKIGAAHGILGYLKLFSFTENKNDIFKYYPWFIKNNNKWTILNLEYKKNNKHFFLIKIKNINNRNEAKKLTNCMILIEKKILPLLKKNEYYWNELLNFKIISTTGCHLGQVDKFLRTQSYDILVIKNYKKNKMIETLIPFIDNEIIKNIDIINTTITVDWNPMFE